MFSIDDLNAVKACEVPHEFEVKLGGEPSGVFLQVLGDESETVATETAALIAAARARANTNPNYVSDNTKLGKQLAALRVVGWRGIKEEYSRENAAKLCMSNMAIADQVIQTSKNLGNFIKL